MFIVYALMGVICLGLGPLFGKTIVQKVNPIAAFTLRTIIAAVFVTIWIISSGIYTGLEELPSVFWAVITIESLLAAVLGDMAYFYALKSGNINEVSIVMSCAPLITIIASCFFFDETVTSRQLTGAILVTAGLITLSLD